MKRHSSLAAALAAGILALTGGCQKDAGKQTVVVYASLDEHYARPILQEFESRWGIQIQGRFDTEADKTTGLYLRVLAERRRPRADVFWNSEILRTVLLAEKNALSVYRPVASQELPSAFRDPEGRWTGFAARARIIIYNKNLVSPDRLPRSIADLADPGFKDRGAMAIPLFGTTATHAGALRAVLGKKAMEDLFRRYRANGVRAVNGNAEVRDLVAGGQLAIGLTDTDDAHEALRAKRPVGIIFPDQDVDFPGLGRPLGTFLIPNTVSLIAGGPNPESGRRLIEFLLSPVVERKLSLSGSAQIPVRPGLDPPPDLGLPDNFRKMEVDYAAAARGLEEAEPFLRELFLQ